MTELKRLRRVTSHLKRMRKRKDLTAADRYAIDVAIEHIEARLIDIVGSRGAQGHDWRSAAS